MRLSPSRRNWGKLAAILGILQGLTWAAMALGAIILHNWSPNLEEPTNYTKWLEKWMYDHFIQNNDSSSLGINFIIRPSDFTIFMWIYFLLSVGWFVISADQLAAIQLEKQRQTTLMIIWGIVTIIVTLIDLIFVCLLARDYAACDGDSPLLTDENVECYTAVGIVMTIAARGYVLWTINLVLSIMMFYGAASITKENDNFASLFSNHNIPRATIRRSNRSRPFQRDTQTTSLDFSRTSTEKSFPRNGPPTPDFFSGDVTPPSFLSRGDKFSY